MGRLTKDDLLSASDLREDEVELPSIGGSVQIRGLAAAYSNEAQTDALELTNVNGEQKARINSAKLEALQVLRGVIDPRFDTLAEVEQFAGQVGPAWHALVAAIQKLSGIDEEAIEQTKTTFPAGGTAETVSAAAESGSDESAGNGRSDIPVRAGA